MDPSQVEQILLNLVVNARDAMPTGGTLSILTEDVEIDQEMATAHPGMKPRRYVVLTVQDSGFGMTSEVKARVFEPFFTTKPRGEGTGLGLATVYGIVKQADGYIAVDSAPRKGTTFRVYLPATTDAVSGDGKHEMQPLRGRGERVLIVEDEPAVRLMVGRILESNGYEVKAVSSGDEALNLDDSELSFDLLLTDVVMPGISGPSLADKMTRVNSRAKVLFMTGYAEDVAASRGLLGSGRELLKKPFTGDELLSKVRATLSG